MFELEGKAFGGIDWTLKYTIGPGGRKIDRGEIEELLREIESEISSWHRESALMDFNASGVLPKDKKHFNAVLDLARDMYEYTNGFFDASLYPLMRAHGVVPNLTTRELKPGMHAFPNVQLDFCGIGKGYAVDCIFEHAIRAGAERCTVFFGGDVRTLGPVRINGGEVVTYGAVATSVKSRDILAKKPGYPDNLVSVWAPTCAQADAIATATLAGFF